MLRRRVASRWFNEFCFPLSSEAHAASIFVNENKISISSEHATSKRLPENYYLSGDSSDINFCFMRKKAINTTSGINVQLSRFHFCSRVQMFISSERTEKLQLTPTNACMYSEIEFWISDSLQFSVCFFRHDYLVVSISAAQCNHDCRVLCLFFAATSLKHKLSTQSSTLGPEKSFSNCELLIIGSTRLTANPRTTSRIIKATC